MMRIKDAYVGRIRLEMGVSHEKADLWRDKRSYLDDEYDDGISRVIDGWIGTLDNASLRWSSVAIFHSTARSRG